MIVAIVIIVIILMTVITMVMIPVVFLIDSARGPPSSRAEPGARSWNSWPSPGLLLRNLN